MNTDLNATGSEITNGQSLITYLIIKESVLRALIISLLIYFVAFCIRNYSATTHNYTVNKHRANSLESSLYLLGKAETQESNDIIIKSAAETIFSHQNTGYMGKGNEPKSPIIMGKAIDGTVKG